MASDDPVGLRRPPWWFASLILHGHDTEITSTGTTVRRRGSIGVRRVIDRDRVARPATPTDVNVCLTIIVTGTLFENGDSGAAYLPATRAIHPLA